MMGKISLVLLEIIVLLVSTAVAQPPAQIHMGLICSVSGQGNYMGSIGAIGLAWNALQQNGYMQNFSLK
jgi:hypothetical protein